MTHFKRVKGCSSAVPGTCSGTGHLARFVKVVCCVPCAGLSSSSGFPLISCSCFLFDVKFFGLGLAGLMPSATSFPLCRSALVLLRPTLSHSGQTQGMCTYQTSCVSPVNACIDKERGMQPFAPRDMMHMMAGKDCCSGLQGNSPHLLTNTTLIAPIQCVRRSESQKKGFGQASHSQGE